MQNKERVGVVLMTYGSATTAEHVREYFEHIYKGKASETLIKDFEERYRLVGHSPLIKITNAQAELLEKKLGEGYIVRTGMRHSEPTIDTAVMDCKAEGATRIFGIILSPQLSSSQPCPILSFPTSKRHLEVRSTVLILYSWKLLNSELPCLKRSTS